ncbi:MAG: cation diffusion facilitator family transporter [Thermodesulfobacteriota bacterium]
MGNRNPKESVAFLSVVSNTSLVLLKIIIGILIGSVSIISEAIHSGVDLLAALITLFAVRSANRSPDEGHPFGHGKIENLSGTIEALLIFLAAGWIIYEAVHKLIHPLSLKMPGLGVGVMFISMIINIWVSQKLFKVGKETDSVALQADAWHLRTDVYTSAGVMAGLLLITIGERVVPEVHFHWLDPVAAIAISLFIIRAAYKLTLRSGRDLLDMNLPEEEKWIRNELSRYNPPIRGFHHLRTRKAGPMRFVELHILLDKDMALEESHRISEKIAAKIRERFPNTQVIVHEEPCDGTCSEKCLQGCLVGDDERLDMRDKK